MKAMKHSYLPKLRLPAEFLWHARQSLEQYQPKAGQHSKDSLGIPPQLKQQCALLALVADVDDALANLNIVLRDLDRLAADPFGFGDADPFARFKFLLRSVHAEFEHFSGFFDRYLQLCGSDIKLTGPEQRRLKVIFAERVRALLDAAEAEQIVTARWNAPAGDEASVRRGVAYIQSHIEAAQPNHTRVADWKKVLWPRVRNQRQMIFDAGIRIVTAWTEAIELMASATDVEPRRRRLSPTGRKSVSADR
jgi:hypothetical protein